MTAPLPPLTDEQFESIASCLVRAPHVKFDLTFDEQEQIVTDARWHRTELAKARAEIANLHKRTEAAEKRMTLHRQIAGCIIRYDAGPGLADAILTEVGSIYDKAEQSEALEAELEKARAEIEKLRWLVREALDSRAPDYVEAAGYRGWYDRARAAIAPEGKAGKEIKDHLPATRCHANRDGDCNWNLCPQNRDGEPMKSGRSCPLWAEPDED